jgi:alcohol dehydrogenase class IV
MAAVPSARWSFPTRIDFGPGRAAALASTCHESAIRRPLVVTDRGLAAAPFVQRSLEELRAGGLAPILFAEVRSNPTASDVLAGAAAFRAGGRDGMIAIGGGSALDCGKTIALMSGQTLPLWRFLWGAADHPGDAAAPIPPIIAVPTTAGTGAEVEPSAIITDEATRDKRAVFHAGMMPATVIVDPALAVGLPAHLTAATGMDALSHALEAYCVADYHPMADGIAVEATRLVHDWLPAAVADGTNLAARANMAAAALMGATAFAKGLGAMHALSHPIGAVFDTHHGLTNAVLMPYVLAFNRAAIEEKMERLAAWLGLPEPSFDAMLNWVLALRQAIGIPHALSALGLAEDCTDLIAGKAARDVCAPTNPIPVGAPELATILRAAIAGRVELAMPRSHRTTFIEAHALATA